MSYAEQKGTLLKCNLCPHRCLLREGASGICGVRFNRKGVIDLPYFGNLSSTAMDPIEKKPLYHFYPGSQIFSVGFFGCNFSCPFCQNYSISQEVSQRSHRVTPEELTDRAVSSGSFGIAYTYSEPLIHFEYVMACCLKARQKGLKNVLVSNGFLLPEPAEKLFAVMDAANIDLKAFTPSFYQKELKGDLDPVLEFIRRAAAKIHLEVTTLVIPGKNDSDTEIASIAAFLAAIDTSIPLHLSCYYPTYQYAVPATSPDSVFHLVSVAKNHLKYVYPGNTGTRGGNTTCPNCQSLLITRTGYHAEITGIKSGQCTTCGEQIPIPM